MTQTIASIDQGTTSTRCILFDHGGHVVSAAQKEHRQVYPQPGWVEHDALEIWQNIQDVLRQELDEVKVSCPVLNWRRGGQLPRRPSLGRL